MRASLREVIETKGLFCALYSDRGSHFFVTPKAGQPVDKHRLTQVGRALKELGVQMIPAYSPPARGRSERNFGTWQGETTAGASAGRNPHAGRGPSLLARALYRTFSIASSGWQQNRKRVRFGVPAGRIWTGCSRCKRNVLSPRTIRSVLANECGRSKSLDFGAHWRAVPSRFMNISTAGFRYARDRTSWGDSTTRATL